ncbi:AUGMIN subunit 3 [Lamellibrachia satsuma]|nr:AUGMIN subunit 3 [Lamellibrachia satsuma]
MSGQAFLDTLRRIGYPSVSELDSQSVSWMFDNDAMAPFLEWFCDEIQPANVLNPKDLNRFHELEKSEDGVLDGPHLDQALQNLASVEQDEQSEEKLRGNVRDLEDELKLAEQKKNRLVQQRNKLSLQQMSLNNKLSRMDSVLETSKREYKIAIEQAQTDNTMVNQQLDELTSAVTDLVRLYKDGVQNPIEPCGDAKNPVFLSQLDLGGLEAVEQKYTQALTAFTKKQFFEGIAEVSGHHAASRYGFLDTNDPDSLLVSGEREDVIIEECKELKRLQACFPKSEVLRVQALEDDRSSTAACEFIENLLHLWKEKPYPQDVNSLLGRLREAEAVCRVVERDVALLKEKEIPRLILDSTSLQVNKILCGDYNLKIMRQDYFISNQEQLISYLLTQKGRSEFLTLAYEIELQGHRDIYRLLTAVSFTLQKQHRTFEQRMKMLQDPAVTGNRQDRETIDSRDKFLTRLYTLLDDEETEGHAPIFLTYAKLAENAGKLNQQLSGLRAQTSSNKYRQQDMLTALVKELRECEVAVYSSTASGQPVLSPAPVVDAITQLGSMLQKLEQVSADIIKVVDQRKKALKSDPLLATERELFTYFLMDADHLRRTVGDVERRVRAQQVL